MPDRRQGIYRTGLVRILARPNHPFSNANKSQYDGDQFQGRAGSRQGPFQNVETRRMEDSRRAGEQFAGVRLHVIALRPAEIRIPNPRDRFRPRGGARRLQGAMGYRNPVRMLEDSRIRFRMHPCRRAGKSPETGGSDGHCLLLVRRHRQMDEFVKGNQDKKARSKGDQSVFDTA